MLERPNICYIFEKLGGSRMSNMIIPCVNCQSHSTRPQTTELVPTMQKALYVIISGEIRFTITCR